MIFHTPLQMSSNVLGIRRFGQDIGQCGALTPAQNVAERKLHKGRSPTAVFRSPEAVRSHRRSVYRLLCAVKSM
jgi:hypothetical protein